MARNKTFTLPFKADDVPPALFLTRFLAANPDLPSKCEEGVKEMTPREVQVAGLMALGMPNDAISKELGISVKTLDIHRAAIHRKLQTTHHGFVLRWMLGLGQIDVPAIVKQVKAKS